MTWIQELDTDLFTGGCERPVLTRKQKREDWEVHREEINNQDQTDEQAQEDSSTLKHTLDIWSRQSQLKHCSLQTSL